MTTEQIIIERKLKKKVIIEKAYDGANLLFHAKINNEVVARIYKSFDKNFNEIRQIRYCFID